VSAEAPHPSFYALDRIRLGLPVSREVEEHVAACAACAAHRAAPPPPAPAWLAGLPRDPARPPSRRRRLLWPALAAVGVAAVLVLVLRPRPAPEGIREKGGPAVTVFVKRGERVFTWDVGSPVRPRDRLRLRVSGGGFHHLSVASLPAAGPPAVLYDGPVGKGAELLPLSFRVDEDGREERLSVILGQEPIPPALHGSPSSDPDLTWREVITFAKETPNPRSGP
jgi:hypothetical protein